LKEQSDGDEDDVDVMLEDEWSDEGYMAGGLFYLYVSMLSDAETEDLPVTKKRKGNEKTPQLRGNRGKLAFLLKMPMDLIVEVNRTIVYSAFLS
jgi:hypothetical protein